jgi:hypothetical protein
MQQRPFASAAPRSARPLGPIDYATPVAWWGWSWEPPVPMSVSELVAAGDLDTRTAAIAWLVLAGHGSVLIAAEQPHSGKTTMLTALLDLLPARLERVYLRGGAETFEFQHQTERSRPGTTLLLANELSSHLPVYLWGAKAVRAFRALRGGYALASTLHADSRDEAIAQLLQLGVETSDLARVDLLIVMRGRRVVSVDRPMAAPLVTADASGWRHDHVSEAALVAERHGWTARTSERAVASRADRIADLVARRVFGIEDVTAALVPLNDDQNEGDRS